MTGNEAPASHVHVILNNDVRNTEVVQGLLSQVPEQFHDRLLSFIMQAFQKAQSITL